MALIIRPFRTSAEMDMAMSPFKFADTGASRGQGLREVKLGFWFLAVGFWGLRGVTLGFWFLAVGFCGGFAGSRLVFGFSQSAFVGASRGQRGFAASRLVFGFSQSAFGGFAGSSLVCGFSQSAFG